MRKFRVAVGVAAALAMIGSAQPAAAQNPAAQDTASITIDSTSPGGRLAQDFVGLSFEIRELGIGNLDPRKGNVRAMFTTLGRDSHRTRCPNGWPTP
jgi:hypothetical protein